MQFSHCKSCSLAGLILFHVYLYPNVGAASFYLLYLFWAVLQLEVTFRSNCHQWLDPESPKEFPPSFLFDKPILDFLAFFFFLRENCGGVLHSTSVFIKRVRGLVQEFEILTKERGGRGGKGKSLYKGFSSLQKGLVPLTSPQAPI